MLSVLLAILLQRQAASRRRQDDLAGRMCVICDLIHTPKCVVFSFLSFFLSFFFVSSVATPS